MFYEVIQAEIQALCQQGDAFADQGDWQAAIRMYKQAQALLPKPIEQWEAATWILAALGDAHFLAGDYAAALKALTQAMICPGAIGNPFLHLRLGQTQFELGNREQAANELTRAFGLEGARIFNDEDQKYFEFLKTRIKS